MTGNDLIARSLRLIGAIAPGENPTPAESADGLIALNDLLDQLSAQSLAVFTTQRQVFNLTSGLGVYTMGAGGNFNVPRPPKIERAGIINLANPSQPLELPMDYITDQKWAGIPVKNIQSQLAFWVWDDQGFPLRNLSLWPIPNVTNTQIALYTWTALSQFADLVTDYEFPPAYSKMLRYNLAVDLAPEFINADSPARVVAQAATSLGIVKRMNVKPRLLAVDQALAIGGGGYYNWLTDDNP